VDLVVTLDVRLAGEFGPPAGLSVVLVAGLLLAVTENLSVAVSSVSVALALTERFPLEVVVRDVGVVDVHLSVAVIGSGDSSKSKENNGDLVHGK